MWDRIRKSASFGKRQAGAETSAIRTRRRLALEPLEDRQLLAASLAPISSLSVPALLGYQVTLDGSGSTNSTQSFKATSDNPNIQVSVASGPYWTLTVSHQPANSSDVTINNEKMTFQLFQDLTPATASRISNLTNSGFYTQGLTGSSPPGPGQFIPRITQVSTSGFGVIQGGSTSATSTASSSGVPAIATEPVQQLAFTGLYQIAMANTGAPNSSDAQFFINYATYSQAIQQQFDFNYTIFGQLVSGAQTVTNLSKVATTTNSGGENSQPITPVTITSAVMTNQNPSGVLHVDTTSASAGDTANITVIATAPDGTQSSQTFKVTVTAYNGPTSPTINFVPLASSISASTAQNNAVNVQLQGQASPSNVTGATLSYSISTQPGHGTISQLDAAKGTLVYTPAPGFTGFDTFQYVVNATGPRTQPATTTSQPATVKVFVGTTATTGAVRQVGPVLIVTPVPHRGRAHNIIEVSQVADSTVAGGQKLVVKVNGVYDSLQPSTNSIRQLVVYGSKAGDSITVDSNVTTPALLDGGHGGKNNKIIGGGGATIQHGWFGRTTLVGGKGDNILIGRAGSVKFKPSKATAYMFTGQPKNRDSRNRAVPPGGTYYRFVNGRIVPVGRQNN